MAATVWCEMCGTALPGEARFCGRCGTAVRAQEPAPTTATAAVGSVGEVALQGDSARPPMRILDQMPRSAQAAAEAPEGSAQVPFHIDRAAVAVPVLGCFGAMLVLGFVGILFLQLPHAGGRLMLSGTALLACAALGGDVFARVDAPGTTGSVSASLGVLPLSLTFVGLAVLAVLFVRGTRDMSARDALRHAGLVAGAAGVVAGVLALVSRLHYHDGGQATAVDASVGASLPSSVVGAVLFGVATLSVALFVMRPDVLPPRLQGFRTSALPALLAPLAVFAVGLAAALVVLLYTLLTEPEGLRQLGVVALFLPNVVLTAVLLTMDVPLHGQGTADVLGSHAGAAHGSFSFSGLTGWHSLWWAAPIVLAATLVAATAVVLVREESPGAARRQAWRVAGSFAALAVVAALLLRSGGRVSTDVSFAGPSIDLGGRSSLAFNPLVAGLVAALWGAGAALLAPLVAARAGGGVVEHLRTRLSTAVTVPHPRGHHEGGSEQSPSWWNRDPARRQQAVVAVAVLVVGAAAAAFVLNRGDDSSTKTSSGQAQRQSRAVPTPSPEGLASASIPAPVTLQTTAPAPSTPTPEPPAGPPQDVARQAFASVPGQAPDGTDASGRPVSYAATNLLDGDPTTCWRVAGDASGSVLTFQLPATRQVTSVGLINGYAKVDPATGDDRYAQERRITRVTWVFPGGTQITQRLTDDTRTLQSIDVPATEATGVVALRIDHTVRPGKAAFDYTAISTVDIEAR